MENMWGPWSRVRQVWLLHSPTLWCFKPPRLQGNRELGEQLSTDIASLPRIPVNGQGKLSGTLHVLASSPVTEPSRSMPVRSGGWSLLPQQSPHPTCPETDASTKGRKEGGMHSHRRRPHLHFTTSQMGSALQNQGLSLRGVKDALRRSLD